MRCADFILRAPDDAAAAPAVALAPDALIILPVRNFVLFPGTVLPLALGRPRSVAAAQEAIRQGRQIGLLMQRDPELPDPAAADLHRIGTIANVLRLVTAPDGAHHLIVQGEQRFRVAAFLRETPFFAASITRIEEPKTAGAEIEARFLSLKGQAREALELLPQAPPELVAAIQAAETPSALADLVAAYMDITPNEKQELLETSDIAARLDRLSRLLAHRIEVLRLSQEIRQQTRMALDERQRQLLLREQLAAIQRQLGEGDDGRAQEIAALNEAVAQAGMPAEVEAVARQEIRRLARMPEAAGEYGMARSYLDWLIGLPWTLPEEQAIDIAAARRILEQDHFGLDKIKRRIIEFLAVRKLAPGGTAPILCFVGPPGVGKTSLGQSIARALARKFVRLSLGGVHDEAEIRGHRRTYIGALPGNIIQSIRKAGTRNCVMMLDEIDKLGAGIQGDPAAALLEVLDPEQNAAFRDNYLAVPFDLSRVMFIATANMLDTVPGALRDRMEIISLPGYTEGEKLQIARRYLLDRQLAANGLTAAQVTLRADVLPALIHSYTREAGVRGLEREIGRLLRHEAVRIAEGGVQKAEIGAADLPEILGGAALYERDGAAHQRGRRGDRAGLDAGRRRYLFIEATKSPGRGALLLTGQLGEVMKESAQTALSLLKNRAVSLGLDPAVFGTTDIHVHVPAGATPKDGPSAGLAMFMALASLFTGRNVRGDTAMTGEISLRGLVMPVGGVREKIVAAAAAGVARVMLPARNRHDWEDIPEDARQAVEFIWVERAEEALAAGLEAAPAG